MGWIRRRGRRPGLTLLPEDLSEWSNDQVLSALNSIDTSIDVDIDPEERARALDRLSGEVIRRAPDRAWGWYGRGMYAKWRQDWVVSLECNSRALELTPAGEREGEPAAWNLGIAATALGDWATARSAWRAFGIDVGAEDGDTPVELRLGLAPLRLNPDPRFVGQSPVVIDGREWETEVVWGQRVCPSRIRITNVPMPESGHRFGDIVLHDGDTVGSRFLGEHELGVFQEITLCRRSELPTLVALVEVPGQGDIDDLEDLFASAHLAAEDWTRMVRPLCRACSEGSPGVEHHHVEEGWRPERTVGLAAEPDRARHLLDAWVTAGEGRSIVEFEVALA